MAAEFDYERAIDRIVRVMWGLAMIGTLAAGFYGGMAVALGFLMGAAVSLLSFRLIQGMVNALGKSSTRPRTRVAVLFGLRYVVFGAVLYVMMKFFGISLVATLAGLLILVAAVVFEIIYELIYART